MNNYLQDIRISLKAKGVLSIIQCLGSDFTVADIMRCTKDKRDSINGALRELEEYGYLVREPSKGGNIDDFN